MPDARRCRRGPAFFVAHRDGKSRHRWPPASRCRP